MIDSYSGTYYRTGRKNAHDIYRIDRDSNDFLSDVHIGCVFNEEDGAMVAAALDVYATAIAIQKGTDTDTDTDSTEDTS
jgi:hypothetical protein